MSLLKPIIYESGVYQDERGTFFPLSLSSNWIQSNVSISKKWTFRGLHCQQNKTAQTKFVSVIKGSIIDLRYGNFEETSWFKLVPGQQILIPKGYAHGFLALEDDTIIQYLVDNDYSKSTELSFNWKSNNIVKEIILAEVGESSNVLISSKDEEGIAIDKKYVETIDYSII
jgi:dTDP-4-dehydrorhamnose 3,5-epimerase